MGRLSFDLGDHEASRRYNERAIELADVLGDSWLGALALANLAQLEQERQKFELAQELLTRALELLRELGDMYEAVYSSACGDLFFESGKFDLARTWYAAGARFFRGSFMTHRHAALGFAAAAALEAHDGDFVRANALLDVARRSASRAKNRVIDASVELHSASVALLEAKGGERARVLEAWRPKLGRYGDPADPLGAVVATSFDARFALRIARRTFAGSSPSGSRGYGARLARPEGWSVVRDRRRRARRARSARRAPPDPGRAGEAPRRATRARLEAGRARARGLAGRARARGSGGDEGPRRGRNAPPPRPPLAAPDARRRLSPRRQRARRALRLTHPLALESVPDATLTCRGFENRASMPSHVGLHPARVDPAVRCGLREPRAARDAEAARHRRLRRRPRLPRWTRARPWPRPRRPSRPRRRPRSAGRRDAPRARRAARRSPPSLPPPAGRTSSPRRTVASMVRTPPATRSIA